MRTFLTLLIAFTSGLKQTAQTVNESRTAAELTAKLKKQ